MGLSWTGSISVLFREEGNNEVNAVTSGNKIRGLGKDGLLLFVFSPLEFIYSYLLYAPNTPGLHKMKHDLERQGIFYHDNAKMLKWILDALLLKFLLCNWCHHIAAIFSHPSSDMVILQQTFQ